MHKAANKLFCKQDSGPGNSVLGSVLFNRYRNGLEKRAESKVRKFDVMVHVIHLLKPQANVHTCVLLNDLKLNSR